MLLARCRDQGEHGFWEPRERFECAAGIGGAAGRAGYQRRRQRLRSARREGACHPGQATGAGGGRRHGVVEWLCRRLSWQGHCYHGIAVQRKELQNIIHGCASSVAREIKALWDDEFQNLTEQYQSKTARVGTRSSQIRNTPFDTSVSTYASSDSEPHNPVVDTPPPPPPPRAAKGHPRSGGRQLKRTGRARRRVAPDPHPGGGGASHPGEVVGKRGPARTRPMARLPDDGRKHDHRR